MNERDGVVDAARQLAAAIARRDVAAIRDRLAPGFVHRTHRGAAADAEAFLQAIEQIPGEIIGVSLEQVEIDMSPLGALVTGVQHAQVRVDAEVIDDRRGFVDWFVMLAGEWRIQAAVDLPESGAR